MQKCFCILAFFCILAQRLAERVRVSAGRTPFDKQPKNATIHLAHSAVRCVLQADLSVYGLPLLTGKMRPRASWGDGRHELVRDGLWLVFERPYHIAGKEHNLA